MFCARTRLFTQTAILVACIILPPAISNGHELSKDPIRIDAASRNAGIVGTIGGPTHVLVFEARMDGATLRSEIRGGDGHRYWLYVEDFESDDPPRVEIDGMPFTGHYDEGIAGALARIGRSVEGALIRRLAFDLYVAAPGADLAAYRRGLETAYQAMQSGYPAEARPQPPRREPRRSTAVALSEAGQPVGIEATAHATADYIFSAKGGFVVTTQHPKAVFTNNFLSDDHELVRRSIGKLPVQPDDDQNIGDSCFGMCGAGCSNDWSCRGFQGWSHEWVTAPVTTVTALCHCARPVQIIDPDCSAVAMPDSFKVTTTSTYGTAVHTITGWSSVGCITHDSCCRSTFMGCWNPGCQPWGLLALAECAAGIGWEVSWSYVGSHGWSYSTHDENECRDDCPECGDYYFPPPIEVEP